MGKGDFVVRLVGDTKNYSSAMAQAKKSLEGFQQQNLSTKAAMSQLTSMLGKYVQFDLPFFNLFLHIIHHIPNGIAVHFP